jgi:hypothetical protein
MVLTIDPEDVLLLEGREVEEHHRIARDKRHHLRLEQREVRAARDIHAEQMVYRIMRTSCDNEHRPSITGLRNRVRGGSRK